MRVSNPCALLYRLLFVTQVAAVVAVLSGLTLDAGEPTWALLFSLWLILSGLPAGLIVAYKLLGELIRRIDPSKDPSPV